MKEDQHWLMREATIKILWRISVVILLLILVPGIFIHLHEHFGIEGSFAFYAWYGFMTCVLMVVVAKALGYVLKRDEDYYDD